VPGILLVRRFRVLSRLRVLLCVLLCGSYSMTAWSSATLWDDYEELLNNYVKPTQINGITLNGVDYQQLRHDPALSRALKNLAAYDLKQLTSREESLAFYINAYNLLAISMVAENWPLTSIRDIGSLFWPVWKREAGVIAGKEVTLDEIEHEILRPMGEARIHFAIVCASLSCPDLRREVYRASQLNQQLDDQVKIFLAHSGKGVVEENKGLRVSRIFYWFAEDFSSQGGVSGFIARYREDMAELPVTDYLPYDWQVNKL
jgi:Protein of unknown function, DUF547